VQPVEGLTPQGKVVKRISGFSLLEVMTAVALISILLALAAPSFRDFTRNNRVTAANNDLVSALNLARSEATRRSTPVTICASANGTTCGAATDWASGWIVFQNAGAAGVIADPRDVVQKWNGATGQIQFATTSAYVQYQPTGTVTTAANIDVSYPACHGLQQRHIQVSAGGTISTQRQPCA
jgi:type IV fimbrial biogenesis protein FimT